LIAWLLLSAFRSSVVDPQTTLQGFLKAVPLGIASSYYDQVFLASLAEVTLLFLLKNSSGCTATNLEFDAAGTSYQGPPTIEVLVNGKSVGRYDIPGRESVASTPKGIIAELQSVAAQTTRFKVDIGSVPDPQRIELRFENDLWAGDGKGGDRNVFIKDRSK
jgi:hypothetical protein